MSINVCEIFESLQGEQPFLGTPMVFLRLYGCNMKCSWCDTKYSWKDDNNKFKEYKIESLIKDLNKYKTRNLYITGGEPLLQETDLKALITTLSRSWNVYIDTNGSIFPSFEFFRRDTNFIVDIKCPSSKENSKEKDNWLSTLENRVWIKCVVASKEDLNYVKKEVIDKINWRQRIILSPMYKANDTDWLKEVWTYCVTYGLNFSFQVHKLVWGKDKKGV